MFVLISLESIKERGVLTLPFEFSGLQSLDSSLPLCIYLSYVTSGNKILFCQTVSNHKLDGGKDLEKRQKPLNVQDTSTTEVLNCSLEHWQNLVTFMSPVELRFWSVECCLITWFTVVQRSKWQPCVLGIIKQFFFCSLLVILILW